MKNILFILCVLISLSARAQLFNPSLHTTTNKGIGIGTAAPVDARSQYYDPVNFVYRDYVSTAEVLSYLYLPKYRSGGFDILVNSGGTLTNGVITGGTRTIYWFKNGVLDANLVVKIPITSVNGQSSGDIITKSADSLKGQPLDTTTRRNGFVITYDSTARKYYLGPGGTNGSSYTQGQGIDITNGVISALYGNPLWNANQLRGRSISSGNPNIGDIPKWDGTVFQWGPDNSALDTAYYSNDTLYLIGTGDTSKVVLQLVPVGDNWGTQVALVDGTTIKGDGANVALHGDTTSYLATKHDRDSLQIQINNLSPGGGGKTKLQAFSIYGDSLFRKVNDSLYTFLRLKAGTNITLVNSGDSTFTINGTPGSAEINTVAGTYTTTDSLLIPAGSFVQTILVKPTSNLTAFNVGIAGNTTKYIAATPVQADTEYQILIPDIYLPTATKLYVSGITSSTQLKIIYQPMHE